MVRIRRFGVVRTATALAVLYALASVIFFAIFAVFAVFLLRVDSSQTGFPGALGLGAGVVGILIGGLVASALYGVLGWIFTAIFCLLYNWAASFTGGVQFELRAVSAPQPAPTWTAPAAPPPAAPPSDPSPPPPASPPTDG